LGAGPAAAGAAEAKPGAGAEAGGGVAATGSPVGDSGTNVMIGAAVTDRCLRPRRETLDCGRSGIISVKYVVVAALETVSFPIACLSLASCKILVQGEQGTSMSMPQQYQTRYPNIKDWSSIAGRCSDYFGMLSLANFCPPLAKIEYGNFPTLAR
jgi:hypothetical protein